MTIFNRRSILLHSICPDSQSKFDSEHLEKSERLLCIMAKNRVDEFYMGSYSHDCTNGWALAGEERFLEVDLEILINEFARFYK